MAEVTLDQVPRKTRELFDKAGAALERGNLDYAVDMFLALLEKEPRLLQARRALRAAQIKRFQNAGGAKPIQRLLAPLITAATQLRIRSAIGKNPTGALQEAERLLGRDPFLPAFYLLQVQAAEAADLPEAATLTLELVRETRPGDVEVLRRLGKLYQTLNVTSKARECFERIHDLRPNDPVAIKQLKDAQAMDTMQKGRWDQAGEKGGFREI
ncbi:MAG: hypothetical protein U1E27_07130, partial [Kiritimatiellia bacterium]|nr:hypothetical protein [Kiritimatiellia bacterium]